MNDGDNLDNSNLPGSNLLGSNLNGSNLPGSNLLGSNLNGSNLNGSAVDPVVEPTVSCGGPILVRDLTVCNRRGLHARAAAKFVTAAERFCASVDVVRDGQSVSARSIMGLMMLGAGRGSTIQLRAEGWDAKEALDALAGLIEAGFDEQD